LLSLQKLVLEQKSVTITFIGLESIFEREYSLICDLLGTVDIKFEMFNLFYFNSIRTYNLLLTNPYFYKRFSQYLYLLIFQLDAYLIGVDLNKFMLKDYTFIGAPWFEDGCQINTKLAVGNGGFSLRKTEDFIAVLLENSIIPLRYWKLYRPRKMLARRAFKLFVLYPFLYYAKIRKWSFGLEWSRYNYENEDAIFSALFANDPRYRVANSTEALEFSFETFPEKCFSLNNNQLPLGCHAWERYDLGFWKSHLSELKNI